MRTTKKSRISSDNRGRASGPGRHGTDNGVASDVRIESLRDAASTQTRLLRNPRRQSRRRRRRTEEGLPSSRHSVSSRSQSRQQRSRGTIQGTQRGLPGSFRSRAARAVRPLRARRLPGTAGSGRIRRLRLQPGLRGSLLGHFRRFLRHRSRTLAIAHPARRRPALRSRSRIRRSGARRSRKS